MHSTPLKIRNYFGIEVLALMLLSLRYCGSIVFKLGLKIPVKAREHCSWRISPAATVIVTQLHAVQQGIYMEVKATSS